MVLVSVQEGGAAMWSWACLVPHPPIAVPEVGRGREKEASKTLEGFRALARALEEEQPDVLVVLSPHQPYAPGVLFVCGERFEGDLASFGAPQVQLEACGAVDETEEILGILRNVPVHRVDRDTATLDHASLVPLWFLSRSWRSLPRLVVANPVGLELSEALALGRELRSLTGEGTWGLMASGDLSHRLIPGAPAGYSPSGRVFDDAVLRSLETSSSEPLERLSPDVLEEAGECGLRSVLTLLGFVGGDPIKTLSYEGPFGVGYATALWTPPQEA